MSVATWVPGISKGHASRGWRELWTAALPAIGLLIMLVALYAVEPRAFTREGLSLVLMSSTPLVLASMAQMCVIAVGDIDLGIGPALGLVNVVAASWLSTDAVRGLVALLGVVVAYVLLGALIHLRQMPAIMVTLGASFVWLGAALLILPTPGGLAPLWLVQFAYKQFPIVPLPIIAAGIVAVVGWLLFRRSRAGIVVRAFGANPAALTNGGRSALIVRAGAYGLAGFFVVAAGLAITSLTTTGDANGSAGYTILTIAAVIVGGAEFRGGVVAPVGTVLGAITIGLVASILTFLDLSSDYQVGIQGLLLLVVLAGRAIGRRP